MTRRQFYNSARLGLMLAIEAEHAEAAKRDRVGRVARLNAARRHKRALELLEECYRAGRMPV